MESKNGTYPAIASLMALLVTLTVISLACTAAASPTPVATPTPSQAATPTPVSQPTAASTPRTTFPTPTPESASGPKYGGTLRWVGDMSTIRTLDPHYSIGWPEFFVNFALYNTLVSMGLDGNIDPELAKSWEFSSDGKAVTFHLVTGVKFHDGTPFNADVAKWNFDRVKDSKVQASQGAQYEPISQVDKVDDATITVRLKTPWRPLLGSMTERPGFIVSPTAVEKYNSRADKLGAYGKNPMGTGPFKFVNWEFERIIVVERNPGYWMAGKPYLDKIVYLHSLEPSVQMAMIRTNEAEVMEIPGTNVDLLRLVDKNPDVKAIGGETGRTYHVQMDTQEPPYNKKALRQAVAYGLNRKALIDTFFGGRARVAYTQEGNGWAYNSTIKVFDYDPQKAKAKLVEAGYPNGITIKYWCTATASAMEYCTGLQAQLAQVGINLDLIALPYSEITKLQYEGKGAWMRDTWWSTRADPHGRLSILYHSKGYANTPRYINPAIDKMIDEAAQVYDTAKAAPMYWEIQRIVAEDAPYIYIAHPNAYLVARKPVQNFSWYPDVILRLRDVWLDK